MTESNWSDDHYSLAKPNFSIESLWNIDDDNPRSRSEWYEYPDPIEDYYSYDVVEV